MENIHCWRKMIVTGSILLILSGFSRAGTAGIPEPINMVRESVNGVLRLLKEPGLGPDNMREKRRRMIMGIVDNSFDFREMSRRTLARRWQEIGSGEKDEFVEKYSTLIKNHYVGKLDSYSGEPVTFEKQIIKENRSAVFTHFVRKGEKFAIIYKLIKRDTGWLVYDMVIEGVSVVKNYRSQFDSILRNEKFAGLLKRIDEKNKPKSP
ncbi:MAG: ABC transporter substrate-binding protein [Desulfobacteraceae bacterium]|nr:ABC transporter substrate-binding protein [Desulfobacteraceae bacterium]